MTSLAHFPAKPAPKLVLSDAVRADLNGTIELLRLDHRYLTVAQVWRACELPQDIENVRTFMLDCRELVCQNPGKNVLIFITQW